MGSIDKTDEYFRLLYDVRGRFSVHRVSNDESKFKLARVKKLEMGAGGIPYVVTHDGRTIRYPDPLIKAYDTVKLDLETGKIIDFVKFDIVHVFATRLSNVFVIGSGNRPLISLPRRKGIKMSILDERAARPPKMQGAWRGLQRSWRACGL